MSSIRTEDIHSLTDFRHNAKAYADRLAKTGRPEILTVNGEAKLVVMAAETYQKIADAAELMASIRMIQQSEADIAAGRVKPMREGIAGMIERLGGKVPK